MNHSNYPRYPGEADYNTNAPSYLDDLGRKNQLIEELSKRIWGYDSKLNLSLSEVTERLTSYIEKNDTLLNNRLLLWDLKVESLDDEVDTMLKTWVGNGTIEKIINKEIFSDLAGQVAEKLDKRTTDLTLNNFTETDRAVIQGLEPGTINAVLGEGNVENLNLSIALRERLNLQSDFVPNQKNLSLYTSLRAMNQGDIYIEKDPVAIGGEVYIHTTTATAHELHVVLLKRNSLDGVAGNFSFIDISRVSLAVGVNKVKTSLVTTGSGDEFLGVIAYDGIAPQINQTFLETTHNYYGTTGINPTMTNFNASLSTTTRDMGVFYEVEQTGVDELKSEVAAIDNRLINVEEGTTDGVVDLVMFMGQSNMAGRGVAAEAPGVPLGQGFEFRAITNPSKLYPLAEPFGKDENVTGSIDDLWKRTGSMASAFAINYYKLTKRPIVGVSASEGGTTISQWQPGTPRLIDAVSRLNAAKSYLSVNGYTVKNTFMVWCQGETDGDNNTTKEVYNASLQAIFDEMQTHGVEKCFLVRIGNHRDTPTKYDTIIQAQTELCQKNEDFVLVSVKFAGMATSGLMKDVYHYTQEGYNIAGYDAGKNTAYYLNHLKEPTMFDTESNALYYSHK